MGFRIGANPHLPHRPSLLLDIVFAHDGGFSWGTLDDYDLIARRLWSATGAEVISVLIYEGTEHGFSTNHRSDPNLRRCEIGTWLAGVKP